MQQQGSGKGPSSSSNKDPQRGMKTLSLVKGNQH